MLKNGKCDSKHKSVSFSFLFYINKIHLAGPKYSIITGHIAVLLNLKFQLDKLKNNKEHAIIVFCNFGFQGSIFLKVTIYIKIFIEC
jgi:TctA family transporter